ncbi:hypothetical protein [Yoonia sp.]|uniref:hypothetical protein n=1 Tax=Yoonia sp. TaxID=2212373 RepID=UPI002E0C85D6|nr:hypothetical protein [Yoonia sp.]
MTQGKTLTELNAKPGDIVEYDGSMGGDVRRQTVAGWLGDSCYNTEQKLGGHTNMSSCAVWRIVSRASDNDGWGEWTSASEWDTGKFDVQMECIDGIHRVRTRPRKPRPLEFWIVDGAAYPSRRTAEKVSGWRGRSIHVREVVE